jgi:hypothetical protein
VDDFAGQVARFPADRCVARGADRTGLQFLRRTHWIITRDPASERDVGRICDAATGLGTNPGELWRYTSPYRGLEGMKEKDSDYFFGRPRETVEVLSALGAPDRLPVLIGNSGAGKSSLARAGGLAALKRQAWPEQAGGRMSGQRFSRTAGNGASSCSSPAPIRSKPWSTRSSTPGTTGASIASPPFGGPEAVLAYLSRYTHRVAISNHRLIARDHRGVT